MNPIMGIDTMFLPKETYEFPSGKIVDASITTMSQEVGASTDVTIQFTIGSMLPTSIGYIELSTPVWSFQNSEEQYYITDLSDCTSSNFASLTIDQINKQTLMLGYTDYNEDNSVPISITCNNWRNPTVPKKVSDFYLRTYDQHKDEIIDSSDSISLDASGYTAREISLIEYILTTPYAGQISKYLFDVHVDIPISSTDKCYFKIQFP